MERHATTARLSAVHRRVSEDGSRRVRAPHGHGEDCWSAACAAVSLPSAGVCLDPRRRKAPPDSAERFLDLPILAGAFATEGAFSGMCRSVRSGITLAELLLALAVIGIVAGIASSVAGRGGAASRTAREVATAVRGARWLAVSEGRPVVLVALPSGSLARTSGGAFACESGAPLRTVWEQTSGVLVAFPSRGIAFAPDGRPRRCDGSGAGNTTIGIASRSGDRAAVIVSITGRIRWERR
jgi:prepilin-type N-terminal cleavage/methylation domain-containing protein